MKDSPVVTLSLPRKPFFPTWLLACNRCCVSLKDRSIHSFVFFLCADCGPGKRRREREVAFGEKRRNSWKLTSLRSFRFTQSNVRLMLS